VTSPNVAAGDLEEPPDIGRAHYVPFRA
jgi:hypothetical protein